MLNKFKILIEGLRGKRKLNVYQRVLRLSIFGSFLTFAVMGGLYIYAILTISDALREKTIELGEIGSAYIEEEVTTQVKTCMMETTKVRAQLINNELEDAVEDVQWLSDFISLNLKNPELHMPHTLPNALYEEYLFGHAVYFFQPRACCSRYRRKYFPRNRNCLRLRRFAFDNEQSIRLHSCRVKKRIYYSH